MAQYSGGGVHFKRQNIAIPPNRRHPLHKHIYVKQLLKLSYNKENLANVNVRIYITFHCNTENVLYFLYYRESP